jgi:hypothetical protein
VAFNDKHLKGGDNAVSPHPNPLPVGEGDKNKGLPAPRTGPVATAPGSDFFAPRAHGADFAASISDERNWVILV